MDVLRPIRDSSTVEQGSLHGAGIVNGLTVFEMMEIIAVDGDFNDLWGTFTEPPQPDYTNALNYFSGQLSSYGYDTQIHNYRTSSSPRAENVCGYMPGTLYPDEWLVLGAHLDLAEPGSGGGEGGGGGDPPVLWEAHPLSPPLLNELSVVGVPRLPMEGALQP